MTELIKDGECPVCSKYALTVTIVVVEVPNFGKEENYVMTCNSCGYKNVKSIPVDPEGVPKKITLKVENSKDLNILVVRGSHSTIEIPELGLYIEPGIDGGESFVTTVKGMLYRIMDNTYLLESKELNSSIDRMVNGTVPFTLIMKDDEGISYIDSAKAVVEVLKNG